MTNQTPDLWTVLSALANVILGAIALFLLFQGQSDRRKLLAQARAEQAKKVTLSFEHIAEKTSDTSYSVRGVRAVIRNDSDKPISFGMFPVVTFYNRPSWDAYVQADPGIDLWGTKHVDLPHAFLGPGEFEIVERPLIGYDGARIGFADSEGNRWVRTGEDGKLYLMPSSFTLRSKIYQGLCRLKPLEWILIRWPSKYVSWRFTKRNEVPLTARWIRFWWGYAPIGEIEPYMLPRNVPNDDWPYYHWARQSRMFAEYKQQQRREATVDKENR